jgi:hypothetical protein
MDGDGRSAFLGLEGVIRFRGKVDGCRRSLAMDGNSREMKIMTDGRFKLYVR